MAFASASTVPVPELIRRGYDRAKGLGHDGLDTVRTEHRALLAILRQTPESALPKPATLGNNPNLVFEPDVLTALYAPTPDTCALRALLAILDGTATLCIDHPWLIRAVEALQTQGCDVRNAALWIATMTVMPQWGSPTSALPPAAEHLSPNQAAALRTALGTPSAILVAPTEALCKISQSLDIPIFEG